MRSLSKFFRPSTTPLNEQEVKSGETEEEAAKERAIKMCQENFKIIEEAADAIKTLFRKTTSNIAFDKGEQEDLKSKVKRFFDIKNLDTFFVAVVKGFYSAGGRVESLADEINKNSTDFDLDINSNADGKVEIKQLDGSIQTITLKGATEDLSNYACEKSPMHSGGGLQKGGLFVIDDIIVGACASLIASAGVAFGSFIITAIIIIYLAICKIAHIRLVEDDDDRENISARERFFTALAGISCVPVYATFYTAWLAIFLLKSPFMIADYCRNTPGGGKRKTARKMGLIKKSKAKKIKVRKTKAKKSKK